jgi:hypothetical protein
MLNTIEQLFKTIGFQVHNTGDRIIGGFNIDGVDSHLVVHMIGSGDGTILNFEMIGLIKPDEVRNSKHIGAFVHYLLAQNWNFTAGSLELNTDGEVRVLVELPLADSELTASQLSLIMKILAHNSSMLLQKGRRVLETGSEEPGEKTDSDEPEIPSSDMINLMIRFKSMAQTAEGRASLLALKRQDDLPPMVRIMVETALQQAVPDEL